MKIECSIEELKELLKVIEVKKTVPTNSKEKVDTERLVVKGTINVD